GNAGTACYGENVPISESEIDKLIEFVREKVIDLTVVGPEKPLVEGIVDRFISQGLTIFGASQKAAMLEGSKIFAKQFMSEYDIPTAPYEVCTSREDVEGATIGKIFPYVIKVDGLAAGKGALIIRNQDDLQQALIEIYEERKFGAAGDSVIVEDFLNGEELSVFAITDGSDYVLLSSAQDHKRIFDGDKGPNTGGMGAYAPAPLGTSDVLRKVEERIIRPVLRGMKERGTPYSGVLYCGLMIHNGNPRVIEFNARFGDPETQVLIPLIKSDLAVLLLSVAQGKLDASSFQISDKYAACVILASAGYPGDYEKGKEIAGIEQLFQSRKVNIFMAGTRFDAERYLTNGGRVLGITVVSKSLNDAILSAYNYVNIIKFEGKQYRSDIGFRVLERLSHKKINRG
ncbi:MAG: phosphoribosylamine--glycine ligase, partial [Candidatus Marinimicrobia bacterium]|nr:phosphoribosylamine--glycine ligase [Candidatus Neomarinimicrobiota bacterium]